MLHRVHLVGLTTLVVMALIALEVINSTTIRPRPRRTLMIPKYVATLGDFPQLLAKLIFIVHFLKGFGNKAFIGCAQKTARRHPFPTVTSNNGSSMTFTKGGILLF